MLREELSVVHMGRVIAEVLINAKIKPNTEYFTLLIFIFTIYEIQN